jgi:hypothetical protein
VCPPPHTHRAERGVGGSIFWKTQEIGLASYSNKLYTLDVLGVCLAEDPEGLLVVCLEVRLPHLPVQDPPELGVAQLTAPVVVLVQDVVNLRTVQGFSFDSY